MQAVILRPTQRDYILISLGLSEQSGMNIYKKKIMRFKDCWFCGLFSFIKIKLNF